MIRLEVKSNYFINCFNKMESIDFINVTRLVYF